METFNVLGRRHGNQSLRYTRHSDQNGYGLGLHTYASQPLQHGCGLVAIAPAWHAVVAARRGTRSLQKESQEEWKGLFWELNPGPLAPEARIMPLDQTAMSHYPFCRAAMEQESLAATRKA